MTAKKRKILRWIYGSLSLTTALFVFQACYGPGPDLGADIKIEGKVVSKATNNPIAGIKVSVKGHFQYDVTDSSGFFKIYTEHDNKYELSFEDIDSVANGLFLQKDTIVTIADETAFVDIKLEQ